MIPGSAVIGRITVEIQGAGDSAQMQVSAIDVLLSNGPVRNVVFEVHPQYVLHQSPFTMRCNRESVTSEDVLAL